ncbi:MAG: GtrA family protein [Bacilli bacterium]|jgi:putative flippase GtrA|nr:GtrA family protein [Bacilli bacterium]
MIKQILKKQEFRFLFVGGLNTLVGYGIYALLLFFQVNYLIANTISTIIGIGHSYLWNRFYTFKSKEKASKEILKFISVYAISYILGTISLFFLKNFLQISPYIAGLINLVLTTLISWFGHKNFSFRKTGGATCQKITTKY